MLRDRYENDQLFERIFRLTPQMEPVLAQIDQLLDDDELFQRIRADLATRSPLTLVTGRRSTPVEVILRLLIVKRLHQYSYEQTERHVSDAWCCGSFVACT